MFQKGSYLSQSIEYDILKQTPEILGPFIRLSNLPPTSKESTNIQSVFSLQSAKLGSQASTPWGSSMCTSTGCSKHPESLNTVGSSTLQASVSFRHDPKAFTQPFHGLLQCGTDNLQRPTSAGDRGAGWLSQ